MNFARKPEAPASALSLVPPPTAETATAPSARAAYPRGSLGPAVHAARLVRWMQDRNEVGEVEAKDLERTHYPRMCVELRWEPENWTAVGAEIRKLLNLPRRQTRYRRGGYRIVYIIPPAALPDFEQPRVGG